MEEILAHTVIAELPNDLAVPHAGIFAFETGPPWHGWDQASMSRLIGYSRPLDPDRRPQFRITLRRVRVRTQLPLQAAEKAFGDWVSPLISRRARLTRRLGYALLSTAGLRPYVTVAAITAFLPTVGLPDDVGPTWTNRRIDQALEVLNEFLVTLGIEANDARIGPIIRGDLPPRIPIVMETQPVPTAQRQGGHVVVPMHNAWWPNVSAGVRSAMDIENASALVSRVKVLRTLVS